MPFTANIEVEQEVVAACMITFFYIYTPADVYQHTFNRSQVATLLEDNVSRSWSTKLAPIQDIMGGGTFFKVGGAQAHLKKL